MEFNSVVIEESKILLNGLKSQILNVLDVVINMQNDNNTVEVVSANKQVKEIKDEITVLRDTFNSITGGSNIKNIPLEYKL